jgi:long-chain acyl-CoA synthetase
MEYTIDYVEKAFIALPDLIEHQAKYHGDRDALILNERRLDYHTLNQLMDKCAAALQNAGYGEGDCMSICGMSSIEYIIIFLAGLRAGLVVAPLPDSASSETLRSMIQDCAAKIIFHDTLNAELVRSATQGLNLNRVVFDETHDILTSGNRYFDNWPAPPTRSFEKIRIEPDWPFNIIYSSGTTGTPKGIIQNHNMRWNHVKRGIAYGYHKNPVTLLSTPLCSNTTLVSFFPTLAYGGTLVILPKFDAHKYLEMAQEHKVTHTMLVPVQYQRIMALDDFNQFDLSSFKMKQCTSSPFKPELKQDVVNRWPGGLFELYGMTEGGATFVLAAHEYPEKLHTVGKAAEGVEVLFINDKEEVVPHGETGEIVGHSPAMMKEYLNNPEKTSEVEWIHNTGKRFIRTGDIGRMDEDGFLILVDRKKDMIISGGFNLFPSDLEQVIIKHPDIAGVAVAGVPSQKWGETPVAFVVLVKGKKLNAKVIMDWANQKLGKIQRLADVKVISKLPRNAIGKILKTELTADYTGSLI